jgi:hypothetical protein
MMAGMIPLILIGLLRGDQDPPRPGPRKPRAAAPTGRPPAFRAAPTPAAVRPAVLRPAVPPVERLAGWRLHCPTRHRHSLAAVRLHDLLDLGAAGTGPAVRLSPRRSERSSDRCPRPTPCGARREFTGSFRNEASRSRRRRSPRTWSAIGGRHRRPGGPSRQPPGKPRLRGLLRRAHRAVQGLVRLSWSWRTSGGASSTSTSPTPPPPSGRRSNSWRPAPGRPPRDNCCAIAMRSTGSRSRAASRPWGSMKGAAELLPRANLRAALRAGEREASAALLAVPRVRRVLSLALGTRHGRGGSPPP